MEQIDIQIEETLDKVRPFLQREGGDIEYIGFKEGIVYLKMVGACEGCMYVDADIKDGVEIILMEEVPGVIRCDATGDIPEDVMAAYKARLDEKNESK